MRRTPNLIEDVTPTAVGRGLPRDNPHRFVECIDPWLGVRPRVGQRSLVKRLDQGLDIRQFKQPRAGGNQQANGVLDWRDVGNEVERQQRAQQVDIPVQRRPRSERHKGWVQRQAELAKPRHHGLKLLAGVALVKLFENDRVDRLHRAGHKQAARVTERRQQGRELDQVLVTRMPPTLCCTMLSAMVESLTPRIWSPSPQSSWSKGAAPGQVALALGSLGACQPWSFFWTRLPLTVTWEALSTRMPSSVAFSAVKPVSCTPLVPWMRKA